MVAPQNSSRSVSPSRESVAQIMDATLLATDATREDVRALLREAQELGCGAVCVSPSMLPISGDYPGLRVATVAGFPSGKHQSLIKATEARFSVEQGADEVDMVIDVANAVAGDENAMLSEIMAVREALPAPAVLKVILESAVLSEEQLRAAVRSAARAGADFVKTSTGFHPAGGASVEAVRIMADELDRMGKRGQVGIKASGGIRSWEQAVAMIEAGATRLGVSAARAILEGAPQQ